MILWQICRVAVSTIIANSGLVPDIFVMGANVLSVFLGNTKVLDLLNKLNFTLGDVRPGKPEGVGTAQPIGVTYRPFLKLYGYSETYESRGDSRNSSADGP